MLTKIRIQNYKSIDDITIDLGCRESAPNGYRESNQIFFFETTRKKKDRVIPLLSIYGANASGKTNIIESILLYITIIMFGFNPKYFSPNKLKKNIKNEIIIEAEFFINNKNFSYLLAFNGNSITQEVLKIENNKIFEIRNKELKVNETLETKMYKFNNFLEIYQTACLQNQDSVFFQVNTFLMALKTNLPGLNKDITDIVGYFEQKFSIGIENNLNPFGSVETLAQAKNIPLEIAFDEILEIMKRLNIQISAFKYDKLTKNKADFFSEEYPYYKPTMDKVTGMKIFSVHKNEANENISFRFDREESQGTKLIFSLIAVILRVLHRGGILIIDEIDRSIHPLVLIPLIKMFKDKKYNKNGAQLIFTSHTTEILEDKDFRISEFLFINNSIKRGTFGVNLTDMEKPGSIRNDINFRKRYIKGYYLGIPYTTM